MKKEIKRRAEVASLVLDYMTNQESRNAVEAAFKFANGEINEQELRLAHYNAGGPHYKSSQRARCKSGFSLKENLQNTIEACAAEAAWTASGLDYVPVENLEHRVAELYATVAVMKNYNGDYYPEARGIYKKVYDETIANF